MNGRVKRRLVQRSKRRLKKPQLSPTCLIYGLIDPITLLIRYVGLTSTGTKRPTHHRRASCPDTYCRRWVTSLQRLGLDYEIVTLEVVDEEKRLAETERWWIAYGRACGWPLTNLTEGGGPSEVALAERRRRKDAKAIERELEEFARAEEKYRRAQAREEERCRAREDEKKAIKAAHHEEEKARYAAARASIEANEALIRIQRHRQVSLQSALALQRKIDVAHECQERLKRAVAARAGQSQQLQQQTTQIHGFVVPKDPPPRLACVCGHEEHFKDPKDHDQVAKAVERLQEHIRLVSTSTSSSSSSSS